jgi:two-component system sensor histidine kinase/response regulator
MLSEAREAEPGSRRTSGMTQGAVRVEPESTRGRILVVEDQPMDRELLVRVLRQAGHEVEAVGSAAEALERVRTSRPEVILCDVCMPGMDGLAFCRQVKAELGDQFVPVLFVTALTRPEHLVAGFEAGAEDYIEKPFDFHELQVRVRTMLRIGRLHAAVRRHAQELEQARQEMEELLQAVSHDLRAPLLNILTLCNKAVDQLQQGTPPVEELLTVLEQLKQATLHAAELARQIVDYGRLGHEPLRPRTFPLALVVEQALRNVAPQLEEAQVEVSQPERWPSVHGDPIALCRVFQNLLDNACKFRDPNRRARIELGWTRAEDTYRFWIRDNGIGIPAEHQRRLFRLFARVDPRRPGFGVGLAAAQRIVARHGGEMGLESEPGIGTTVWFSLPADSASGVERP